jgi:hypothetical protein
MTKQTIQAIQAIYTKSARQHPAGQYFCCGKARPAGWPENVSCQQCADAYLWREQCREEGYQEVREAREAQAYAEREAWRAERREARVQEWVAAQEGRTESDYPWGDMVPSR